MLATNTIDLVQIMKICLLSHSQTIMPSIPIATRAQIVTLKALGYERVETRMERKRDKKDKAKQMPKKHEQPQTRVLRKRERQGNADLEGHEGVDVEIGPEAAGTERKQREGEAKELPSGRAQAGHSRVLRRRERR
jgi:hypothetical protein